MPNSLQSARLYVILYVERILISRSETKIPQMIKIKPSFRYTLALLALAGLGIMSYLTYIHYASAKSFCDISAEVSCDVVTTSIYSEIFGIPVSVLGIFYFGTVLYVVLALFSKEMLRTLFFLTL